MTDDLSMTSFTMNGGKGSSTNAHVCITEKTDKISNDVKDHSSFCLFALDQQNRKDNFKLLPSTFQICQSSKIFVLSKEESSDGKQ